MSYTPSREYLQRYARLLVNFALGGGGGIKAGDVVLVHAPDCAKPLYVEACRAVWEAGGQVVDGYYADDEEDLPVRRVRYDASSEEQLDFFAEAYYRGMTEQIDHGLHIIGSRNPHALEQVPPERIMRSQLAQKPFHEWLDRKEESGEYTWTIGLYPTQAMADEAKMSLEEYWEQVSLACFLDEDDPTGHWREVNEQLKSNCAWLNGLPIDRVHLEGEDVDLWVRIGEHRKWVGGEGRNIPSFEVFTSPDWRGTEGRIRFSEPLFTHGALITGIELEFSEGKVVRASAEQNESLLKEMISAPNADRIGEFSMTDARLSRITKFMANTLYDENVGGPFGNTHLAIGLAFKTCYDGDPATVSDEEWDRLGFNDSAVHTDIVSTTDRTITAHMRDGSEQVIYAGGRFQHD